MAMAVPTIARLTSMSLLWTSQKWRPLSNKMIGHKNGCPEPLFSSYDNFSLKYNFWNCQRQRTYNYNFRKRRVKALCFRPQKFSTQRAKNSNGDAHLQWWQERIQCCKNPLTKELIKRLEYSNLMGINEKLKNGREKVLIVYNKPNIKFQRAGRESSIIMWDLASADSAAFSSFAPNFTAKGIGFRNAAPPALQRANGKKAVAALLAGDMAAFYGCGFSGAQDTLFDYQGRHYFKDCYIEGSIDFIFGHGQSTYKRCELHAIADRRYLSGSITAQNRATPAEISGFVFIGCKITGTGHVFLGRAWGAYSRVIFAYTYMANIIVPQGWDDWGLVDRHGSVHYGEY